MKQIIRNYVSVTDANIDNLMIKKNSFKKSGKCNQCDYEYSHMGTLRTHFKKHRGKKSKNVTSVVIHPIRQAI